MSRLIDDAVHISDRFAREPVFGPTGKGFYKSAGAKGLEEDKERLKRHAKPMTPLGDETPPWVADFGWTAITEANAALCGKTASFHGPTSDGHEECRAYW